MEDTAAQVHEEMRRIKTDYPGLHSAASMEMLARLPYGKAKAMLLAASAGVKASGLSSPLLSNLGLLADGPLFFGEIPAAGVYIVTPAMHAPAFMLGASTYNRELTLVAAYFEGEREVEQIRCLLASVQERLCETHMDG